MNLPEDMFVENEKILLITENLGSGGAERQLCGLSSMLTEAGYPCRLITYVENQFYESYLRQNGVDYQFVPELWKRILVCLRLQGMFDNINLMLWFRFAICE